MHITKTTEGFSIGPDINVPIRSHSWCANDCFKATTPKILVKSLEIRDDFFVIFEYL